MDEPLRHLPRKPSVWVRLQSVPPLRWLRGFFARCSFVLCCALRCAIKFYSYFISPMLPQSCRFYPRCSSYWLECLERHGLWRGVGLGLRRILRCHPWHPGGYDPVPEKKETPNE